MDNIEWIIAFIAFSLLVYPIMQMIPSEKEKRQVALRQAAMAKGLRIEVRHPKLIQTQINDYPNIMRCVGYGLPLKATSLDRKYTAIRCESDPEGWFWLEGIRPLAAHMHNMLPLYRQAPAYCLAIEQGLRGSSIFFIDSGKNCNIDEIYDFLEQLNLLISIESEK